MTLDDIAEENHRIRCQTQALKNLVMRLVRAKRRMSERGGGFAKRMYAQPDSVQPTDEQTQMEIWRP